MNQTEFDQRLAAAGITDPYELSSLWSEPELDEEFDMTTADMSAYHQGVLDLAETGVAVVRRDLPSEWESGVAAALETVRQIKPSLVVIQSTPRGRVAYVKTTVPIFEGAVTVTATNPHATGCSQPAGLASGVVQTTRDSSDPLGTLAQQMGAFTTLVKRMETAVERVRNSDGYAKVVLLGKADTMLKPYVTPTRVEVSIPASEMDDFAAVMRGEQEGT